jgi:hypothetical protein
MPKIFTIGYLDHCTLPDLAGYCALFGALCVDIRFTAYSANPTWRQPHLVQVLGEDYYYCQALGNKNHRTAGAAIALFAPVRGLRELRPILATRPVILLCACREWEQCHRKLAAEVLASEFHLPIEHLPGNLTRWVEC